MSNELTSQKNNTFDLNKLFVKPSTTLSGQTTAEKKKKIKKMINYLVHLHEKTDTSGPFKFF